MPLVSAAVPEQVGAGSGRRCGDRRGRQPRGGRLGPGRGWTGLRRAERCLLQFALQPRQPQPDTQRAERPQLRAERRRRPPIRRPLGIAATASLGPGGLGPGGQTGGPSGTVVGSGSLRWPRCPAASRPSRPENPSWPLYPLLPSADRTSCPSRRPPLPAASPWRPTVRAARGQCVFLHHMLTLAKLPEIFSTKDLVLGW